MHAEIKKKCCLLKRRVCIDASSVVKWSKTEVWIYSLFESTYEQLIVLNLENTTFVWPTTKAPYIQLNTNLGVPLATLIIT